MGGGGTSYYSHMRVEVQAPQLSLLILWEQETSYWLLEMKFLEPYLLFSDTTPVELLGSLVTVLLGCPGSLARESWLFVVVFVCA